MSIYKLCRSAALFIAIVYLYEKFGWQTALAVAVVADVTYQRAVAKAKESKPCP